ncbi:MAG: hydrogenase maturation protease [Chloroflexi bacterium]|nr:hydrogenase maturation protease [Chloroflexota bacterium]
MSPAERPLVVVGVGNVLRGDDGAGVRVIERLQSLAERDPQTVPPGTRLVDGGTLGLDVLPAIDGARGLVLVDAVRLGGAAGTVTVLRGDAIEAAGGPGDGLGPGAIGELVATARFLGLQTGPVALVGIEAAGIDLGLRLSTAVEGALPAAMVAVRDELRRMDGLAPSMTQGGAATARMAGATA